MANTPNFSTSVPVTIPLLGDSADIEKAFKVYHQGSEDTSIVYDDSIAGALNKKAPLASPVFTGTVTFATGASITLPANTVASSNIVNGTIINEDISASAAIAQSKIAGLVSDLAAKAPLADPTFSGTVTATTFAGTATNATRGAVYGTGFVKITVLAGATGPSSPSTGDVWISF